MPFVLTPQALMTAILLSPLLTVQEITKAMVELRQQVVNQNPLQKPAADSLCGLELCASFSTLMDIFMALRHKLLDIDGPEVADMMDSFLHMLVTTMQ